MKTYLYELLLTVAGLGAMMPLPAQEGLGRHDFLYAGESMQRRMFIVENGQSKLIYDDPQGHGEISDAVLLTDGNILIAHQYAIAEIGPGGNKIWNYAAPEGTEIHTIQPIGKDRVLFVQNGQPAKVVIMKIPECNIVNEFELPAADGIHGQFRNARLTSAGTLLVANMGLGFVSEYNADGKEINRWDFPAPWSVSELKNGHLLIVGNRTVREIQRDGKIVLDINTEKLGVYSPQKAVRLSNGHTIVNEWWNEWGGNVDKSNPPVQAVEFDSQNNIVWKLCFWQNPDLGPATTIQPLNMAVNREEMYFGYK